MQGKWIKTAAVVIAVPVVTISAFHMVRAYEEGTTFHPMGSNRDLQVNQVVFSGDEDTTARKNNEEQDKNGESELWEKDKTAEDSLNPSLKNSADYLFQTGRMNLPGNEETVNLTGDETPGEEAREKTWNNALLPGNVENDTGNNNYVYDVTEDTDKADLIISGSGQNGGENGGSTAGNGTGGGNGTGAGEPAPTGTPAEPVQTPQPKPTLTPLPTSTPQPTARPADTVKDPETEKPSLTPDMRYTDGPFSEKSFEDRSDKDTDRIEVVIEAADQANNLYGYLYMGQSVERDNIYCALNTYVIVDDSYRYYWQKDQLRSYKDGKPENNGYVDIRGVSFDGGKTWKTEFPVTIPIDIKGVDMRIRAAYRYSTKDEWTDAPEIEYSPAVSRVYVLNRKLTSDVETIDSSMIVNTWKLTQDTDKKYNLYQEQTQMFASDPDNLLRNAVSTYSAEVSPQSEEQQYLFPGWMENGEPVNWFYEITPGRHILEPMDMIPLSDDYRVELELFRFSEDYQEDPDEENYGYLQTLKSYSGDSADLVVPEGIQAIKIDDSITVDNITIPRSTVICKTDDDTLEVRKSCNVSKNNPVYKAKDGILMDRKETQILEIPSQLRELVIPNTITGIHMSARNQLKKVEIQAETEEQIPQIDLQKLKNCDLVMKSELVDRFLTDCKDQFTEENNNGIIPSETPSVRYTVLNDTIVNNQGSLRKVLKESGDTIFLANGVSRIEAGAFRGEQTADIPATILNMPQTGREVTLEKDCFADSRIQTIRCYNEKQAENVTGQLQNIGRTDITVQIMKEAATGYWYTEETDGSLTLVSVPEDITSFDGVWDAKGNPVEITAIGDSAFSKCKKLQWVMLPASVKKIGYEAFRGCSAIQGILIDSKDEIFIGDRSMEGCSSLRFLASNAMTATRENDYAPVITDENNLHAAKNYFFYVLNGSTGYNGYATEFSENDKIDSYVMEDLDETGEYKMLYGATGDTSWLALRSGSKVPEKVMLPETTKNIYMWAMAGTTAADGTYTVNWEKLKDLYVVNEYAFYHSNLSGKVTVGTPESICYIESAAFSLCNQITEIAVPGEVISLGKEVFQGDTGLTKVTFGKMTEYTSLYSSVFEGCSALRDIYMQQIAPQLAFDMYNPYSHSPYRFNIEDWGYDEEAELLRIHVPEDAVRDYIKKWRYSFAGYLETTDTSAYQNMWDSIQFTNMDWETWEFPEDEVVDALARETLLEAENHLRKILGVSEVTEPVDFYPYRVDFSGMITLVGAPSDITEVRLDAGTLGMPEGWGLDYVATDAFKNCRNLRQVIFPETFAGIYSNAFRGVESDNLILQFEGSTPPALMEGTEEEPFTFGIDMDKVTIIIPEGMEDTYVEAWAPALAENTSEEALEAAKLRLHKMFAAGRGEDTTGTQALTGVSDGNAVTVSSGNAETDSTQEETVQ